MTPAQPLPDALYEAAYLHRADVLAKLEPILTAYYPSNFIQAFTDGPELLLIMTIVWLHPRKPGVIAATFLGTYGAARLLTEQFRQIDEGVFMLGPITLPMMLSIAMIAMGLALSVWASRQASPTMGGLIKRLDFP